MALITRGCRRAIHTGAEQLTTELLDQVRNDEAAEQARQELAAAVQQGLLTARVNAAGGRAAKAA